MHFVAKADRIGEGLDMGCERKRDGKVDLWFFVCVCFFFFFFPETAW